MTVIIILIKFILTTTKYLLRFIWKWRREKLVWSVFDSCFTQLPGLSSRCGFSVTNSVTRSVPDNFRRRPNNVITLDMEKAVNWCCSDEIREALVSKSRFLVASPLVETTEERKLGRKDIKQTRKLKPVACCHPPASCKLRVRSDRKLCFVAGLFVSSLLVCYWIRHKTKSVSLKSILVVLFDCNFIENTRMYHYNASICCRYSFTLKKKNITSNRVNKRFTFAFIVIILKNYICFF